MTKLAVVRMHRLEDEPELLPIVRGLPIPNRYKGHPMSKVGKTMRALGVGDSFMVKASMRNRSTHHKMAERIGIKIETRSVGDGYLRIWRIA